jgi:hypothetical protein
VSDDAIIDNIEHIRQMNNKCWMDLVRLALRVAPVETKKLLQEIESNDRGVARLLREIS